MKSLQLGRPPEVAIEISEPVPTDAEIEADFKDLMGMKQVSMKDVARLRSLGVHLKHQGILETQRGAVYVTQMWALGVCSQLNRLIMQATSLEDGKPVDVDEVCKLVESLRKLASTQAELSAVMQAHEPKSAGQPVTAAPPNLAFEAGAIVIGGNAQAHFHPKPEDEKGVAPANNGS